jgi:hypothetical protein
VTEWSGWVVAAIGGGGVGTMAYTARSVREILKRSRLRDEDWYGEPGRPGVPPRLGVMERVAVIEETTTRTEKTLDQHLVDTKTQAVSWQSWRTSMESWRATVDAKQAHHDEQIAMWDAIGKIADSQPPEKK